MFKVLVFCLSVVTLVVLWMEFAATESNSNSKLKLPSLEEIRQEVKRYRRIAEDETYLVLREVEDPARLKCYFQFLYRLRPGTVEKRNERSIQEL